MSQQNEGRKETESPEYRFAEVPVDAIEEPSVQLRHSVDEDAMEELRASIRERGVLVPLVVRETEAGYELVAGLRRLRCAAANGLATVPAMIVRQGDAWSMWATVAENRLREGINPVDEAVYLAAVLDKQGLSGAQAAALLQVSESWVSQRLSLLRWPAEVREAVRDRVIEFSVGREIAGIRDADIRRWCIDTARRCGCSVRQAAMWRHNWAKGQSLAGPRLDLNESEEPQEPHPLEPTSPLHF